MRETSNFIGGAFGTGTGPEQDVINPATGEVIWTYRADEESSVAAALAAALERIDEAPSMREIVALAGAAAPVGARPT